MPSTVSPTAAERRALLHYYRRHPDPAMRMRAPVILMLADGYPWSRIGSVLYCSPGTINHWRHRLESGGVEALVGQPRGAPAHWSDEADALLRHAMERSPDAWGYRAVNRTVALLRDHVEKQWGQKPSDNRLRQRLRELD